MIRRLGPVLVLVLSGCGSDGGNENKNPPACDAGLVRCGEACIDVRIDESACGACGVACDAGEICSAGACRRICSTQKFVATDAVVLPVGGFPAAATAADWDGDGLAEIIVADDIRKAQVFPQIARGEFGAAIELADTKGPAAVAVADLDEDGMPDLVFGEGQTDRILSLRNTGSGSFTMQWIQRIQVNARGLAVGELDGDGHLDFVATARDQGDVILLRGVGDGTFAELARFSFTSGPEWPAIGDFNGDGHGDVAFVGGGTAFAHVLYGDGEGYQPEPIDGLDPITGLAAGDFDGDGLDDLALATTRGVSLLLGRSTGPLERIAVPESIERATLAAGDVDGDGLAEVVAVGSAKLEVIGFEGTAPSIISRSAGARLGGAPVLVDIDGDRALDLLTVWRAGPGSSVESAVAVIYGDCL